PPWVSQITPARPPANPVASFAQSPSRPAANAHPTQKSCRAVPPAPPSALPPRSPPTPSPSRPPALHTHAPHTHPPPAPATPSDPTSRSPSAETPLPVHTPPAPCTPATSPPSTRAALPRLPHPAQHRLQDYSPPSCNTPPVAYRRPYLPGPPPPLPARRDALQAAPQSLPTRSGILEPLPDRHSDPQTRCCRPLTTSPDPPSGTSVLPHPKHTDPAQSAPPSTPLDSNTHVRLPLPRYTTLPPPPPAPAGPTH